MSGWNDSLSPRIQERLAAIGDLSPEEKELMRNSDKIDAILSEFYSSKIDADGLWEKLKDHISHGGNASLLRDIQIRLIDSLKLESPREDFIKRADAVLAIETIKDVQNTSAVEQCLHSLNKLRKNYEETISQAYENLQQQMEKNPQLRMEQVRQGNNTSMVQLSVDEAIKRNPQWKEFISQQEMVHAQEFEGILQALKADIK